MELQREVADRINIKFCLPVVYSRTVTYSNQVVFLPSRKLAKYRALLNFSIMSISAYNWNTINSAHACNLKCMHAIIELETEPTPESSSCSGIQLISM